MRRGLNRRLERRDRAYFGLNPRESVLIGFPASLNLDSRRRQTTCDA
jgi:hypothetical protein